MELMNATFAELLKKSAVATLPRQAGICANSAKYNSLVGPGLTQRLHIHVRLYLLQFHILRWLLLEAASAGFRGESFCSVKAESFQ